MLLKFLKNKIFLSILVIFAIYINFPVQDVKKISIDKTFVINLDKNPDRYNVMKNKFKSMGFDLPITRFSAIDGRKISFTNSLTKETFTGEEILKNKIWLKGDFNTRCSGTEDEADHVFIKNVNQGGYNKRIPGEIGCICSHKKIWQEIVEKGYENTLVFEDDVILFPFFNSLFNLAIKNTPKNYDLLLISFKNYGQAFNNEAKNNFSRFFLTIFDVVFKNPFWKPAHKNIMSSQGYIISNEGAKKLLECEKKYSQQSFLPIDVGIMYCINNKHIITYASKPKLVISDTSPSNVSSITELDQLLNK